MTLDWGAIVAAIVAGLAVFTAAVMTRRTAREANRIDAFEAAMTGMQAVVDAYGARIGALELELTTVKTALVDEQRAHAEERRAHADDRGLFLVATRHIRDVHAWYAAWAEGDREGNDEPPAPPDALAEWI